MKSVNGYESLADVLERAFDQAATGKGAERHAVSKPFDQQPMQELISLYGVGFALGQAAKKSQESQRLPAGRDVAELLGAINYLAGAVIALERGRQEVQPEAIDEHGIFYTNGRCEGCGRKPGEKHGELCGLVSAWEPEKANIIMCDGSSNTARRVIAAMADRSRKMANDNEQPHDCCPVCGYLDGFHHEKCTAAPGSFGVHDV